MGLYLTNQERVARARGDLRMGLPVLLRGPSGAALALAAEEIQPERLADIRAFGAAQLVITQRRAETLRAHAYDGDLARIALPEGADTRWICAVADPASDLHHPFKGPFESLRGGDAEIQRRAIYLAKSARLLPALVIVPVAEGTPGLSDLTAIDISVLAPEEPVLHEVSAARLPLRASSAGRVRVFRPGDGSEEHYVVEIGAPDPQEPVLTRLHSACFTGDVIGSLKCDCGPQLDAALAAMGEAGAGVLLYLNQEGRGIGLANKMRAYSLQNEGFDTVEANHRLGFEDDERDFRIGAEMLKTMGISEVRLMTNNPAKIERMEAQGLHVAERVPLRVGERAENAAYLATKAKKSGHLL